MRTFLFCHAHPDDEALLTSGTMARAAAAGHRVILLIATDGAAGLAAQSFHQGAQGLAQVRRREVEASARALGVTGTYFLDYPDSGLTPIPEHPCFANTPINTAAERIVDIMATEHVDTIVGYDPRGGYGHPDHIQLHQVAVQAARQYHVDRYFEATVNRDLLVRGLNLAEKIYPFPDEFDAAAFRQAYSAGADITHRINVRRFISNKRASMRAHASQATADQGDRTLAAFLRIPPPLFHLVFGTEWFIERPVASLTSLE